MKNRGKTLVDCWPVLHGNTISYTKRVQTVNGHGARYITSARLQVLTVTTNKSARTPLCPGYIKKVSRQKVKRYYIIIAIKLVVLSYCLSNSNSYQLLISNNEYCICTIVKVDITKVMSKLVKEVAVFESLRSLICEISENG